MRRTNRFKYFSSNYSVSLLPRRLEVFKRPKWDRVQQHILKLDKIRNIAARASRKHYFIKNFRWLRLYHALTFQKRLTYKYSALLLKSREELSLKFVPYFVLLKKVIKQLKEKIKLKRKILILCKKASFSKYKKLAIVLNILSRSIVRLNFKVKYILNFLKQENIRLTGNDSISFKCYKYIAAKTLKNLRKSDLSKLLRNKAQLNSISTTNKFRRFKLYEQDFTRVNKYLISYEYFRFIPTENSLNFEYLSRMFRNKKSKLKFQKHKNFVFPNPLHSAFVDLDDNFARGNPSKDYIDLEETYRTRSYAKDQLEFKRFLNAYYDDKVQGTTVVASNKDKSTISSHIWCKPFYLPYQTLWYFGLIKGSIHLARTFQYSRQKLFLNAKFLQGNYILHKGDILTCNNGTTSLAESAYDIGYINQKKNFYLAQRYRMRSFIVDMYSRNLLVLRDFNDIDMQTFWDLSPQNVNTSSLNV